MALTPGARTRSNAFTTPDNTSSASLLGCSVEQSSSPSLGRRTWLKSQASGYWPCVRPVYPLGSMPWSCTRRSVCLRVEAADKKPSSNPTQSGPDEILQAAPSLAARTRHPLRGGMLTGLVSGTRQQPPRRTTRHVSPNENEHVSLDLVEPHSGRVVVSRTGKRNLATTMVWVDPIFVVTRIAGNTWANSGAAVWDRDAPEANGPRRIDKARTSGPCNMGLNARAGGGGCRDKRAGCVALAPSLACAAVDGHSTWYFPIFQRFVCIVDRVVLFRKGACVYFDSSLCADAEAQPIDVPREILRSCCERAFYPKMARCI